MKTSSCALPRPPVQGWRKTITDSSPANRQSREILTPMRILACIVALIFWPAAVHAENYDTLLEKSYAYGIFTFGMYKAGEGNAAESLAAFQIALEKDPKLGRASFHIGNALMEKKDFEGAARAYEVALQNEPDFLFAHYNSACAAACLNQKAKALTHLEAALQAGYNRYESISKDSDFILIKDAPELRALIEKYQAAAKIPQGTAEFLLATDEGKSAIVQRIFEKKDAGWRMIADKALLNSSHEVRAMGVALYLNFGTEERIPVLVQGLFDNNGYVNKYAGNALVQTGPTVTPYMDAIISSKYDGAKFYAQQVNRLLEKKPAAITQ
jgi:tetratricopeptide (TPR) repeat protein